LTQIIRDEKSCGENGHRDEKGEDVFFVTYHLFPTDFFVQNHTIHGFGQPQRNDESIDRKIINNILAKFKLTVRQTNGQKKKEKSQKKSRS
jgi:hypothetical protein